MAALASIDLVKLRALASAGCTLADAAARLALHPRTLARRLPADPAVRDAWESGCAAARQNAERRASRVARRPTVPIIDEVVDGSGPAPEWMLEFAGHAARLADRQAALLRLASGDGAALRAELAEIDARYGITPGRI